MARNIDPVAAPGAEAPPPAAPSPAAAALPRSRRAMGVAFSLLTAALLAAQEPLSGPAAQKLAAVQYVLVTQIALALAAPFLLLEAEARRDFLAILGSARAWKHLAALMAVGLSGLALYNLGLSHAQPVVISAILNLSPFWAAAVAWAISGVPLPAGRLTFAACLLVAFAGAMTVTYSQSSGGSFTGGGLLQALRQGSWYFAIGVPAFTALSGSLIEVWFRRWRDSAAIAAALLTSSALLIPACCAYLWIEGVGFAVDWRLAALLMAGAILASAVGRLFYQYALRCTGNDNGFVTMFFLLSPALVGVYSWLLSPWIPSLKFSPNPAYFAGLVVTAAALYFFARRARRR